MFIWGLMNYNSRDTDSGKTKECSKEEKSHGLIKAKGYTLDTRKEIFVLNE